MAACAVPAAANTKPRTPRPWLLCPCILTADLNRNIERVKGLIRMAPWNEDGFKTGICSRPPVGERLRQAPPAACAPCCVCASMAQWRGERVPHITGICARCGHDARPPPRLSPRLLCAGVPFSLLSLANNCAVAGTFSAMQQRFGKLYQRRLYVHHYTQHMEAAGFEEALETVAQLAEDYRLLDNTARPPPLHRFYPQAGGGGGGGSGFGQNSLR